LPDTKLSFEGTYQIAWVLLLFSLGHIFVLGKWFFQRAFYAARDSFTPLIAAIVSLLLTVFLSIGFTNLFSHNTSYSISGTQLSIQNFFTQGNSGAAVGGIALAMSIAYTVEFFILFIVFNKTKVLLEIKKLFIESGKKLLAGFCMLAVLYLIYKIWNVVTYLSVNNYSRGSQLLNFVIIVPFLLFLKIVSAKLVLNTANQLKSKLFKSFVLFFATLPLFIYTVQFINSPVEFGLLYGLFTLVLSYSTYLVFFSLMFKFFIITYGLLKSSLKLKTRMYLRIFLASIFSYVSLSLLIFSSSIVDIKFIHGLLTSTTLNLLFLTVISIFCSFMVYYLSCLLLKVEELKLLSKYLNPIFKLGGIRI